MMRGSRSTSPRCTGVATALVLREHPLKQAQAELHLHGHCIELALRYLPPQAVDAYVAHRFSVPQAHAIGPVMYQRTAGHPLFMVHLAAYLAQQVELDRISGEALETRIAAAVDVIPSGVQHLIALQLGRLSADEQRVLEAASLVGVEFAVASVAAALQVSLELAETACAALAQHGLFLETSGLAAWPDGTLSGQYRFRHALYQQVLYRRLSEVQRAQGHQRIGTRLEGALWGGDYRRAVQYLQQAVANATRRNAPHEVIALATKGVALLHILPEATEHLHQELDLQVALGRALIATKGHTVPEVAHAYARARELCEQTGDTSQLFPVLRGLTLYYVNRWDLQTTSQLGEQLLRLAQAQNDPALLMLAHHYLGVALFYRGQPYSAQTHHTQARAIYTPQEHRTLSWRYGVDLGVSSYNFLAWELWELGYPDQALQHSLAARLLAQEVSHPYSLAYALGAAAHLHQFRREAQVAHEQSEAVMTLSTEQGAALWMTVCTVIDGWALAMQGQGEAGIAQMRQGLAATEAMGYESYKPYVLGLLAEAYGAAGRPEEGLNALAKVASVMETTESRWYKAELFRLKGALVLQQSANNAPEAEACFHQALDIARQQHAKSWELCAATSLARLWQQQGKQDNARALLTDVYGWFTEGFDTHDLQEATALLKTLT